MSLAFSSHRNLAVPDALRLYWNKVRDLGCHVTRRNTVHSGELYPFHGQRFAKMSYACFCCVVLQLDQCTFWMDSVLLTAACSCGTLAICPLIEEVAMKLP